MLNCCIKHKLEHQQKLNTPNIKTHSSDTVVSHSHSSPSSPDVDFHTPISSLRDQKDSQSSSDDEFYEALEDVPHQVESEHETSGMEISEMDSESHAGDDRRTANVVAVGGDSVREGVLKQCGDLVLVATGQPLCIPVTQVGGALWVGLCNALAIVRSYNSVAKLLGSGGDIQKALLLSLQ
jgi:hypothetical protein